jgi:hypothetical protein
LCHAWLGNWLFVKINDPNLIIQTFTGYYREDINGDRLKLDPDKLVETSFFRG